MRRGLLLNYALLASLCGLTQTVQAQAPPPAGPPVLVTASEQFTIPFRYDPQELKRLQARQVHLFLSYDQGISWELAQTTTVEQQQFVFQAPHEGTFWFTVAISGADNRYHPDPQSQPPGLQVILDRQPPDLQLQVLEREPGRLELSWQATDDQIAIETLGLEFRNSAQENWKTVYITRQPTGQTSWKFQPGQQPEVRGAVSDRAGNRKFTQVTLNTGRSNSLLDQTLQSNRSANSSAAEVHTSTILPVGQSGSSQPLPTIAPHPRVQLISSEATAEEAGIPQKSKAGGDSAVVPSLGLRFPAPAQTAETVTEIPSAPWREQSQGTPPVSQQSPSSGSLPVSSLNSRIRYLNAHEFQIDYQVTGVGPSGVGVVELFVTQDQGRQWWRYGVDADLVSPMKVKVPADGAYGFHFRIHSGVGHADPPPQPGQAPQIQVLVDTTAPRVKLLKCYQGHGSQIQLLTVQWDCVDEHLGEKSIQLFCSGHPAGPWQQVEQRLDNVGSHTFALPENAPTRLFVKVQATDAAGNVGEASSEEPLLIDLSRPSARVIMIDAIR